MGMTPQQFHTIPIYILCHSVNYAHHKTLYMHIRLITPTKWTHQQGTSAHTFTYKTTHTCHVYHSQSQLSCSHPQHNSISMHINMHYTLSTTHHTAFHNPPICTQQMQGMASWQNGTKCRDGVKSIVVPFPSTLVGSWRFHPLRTCFHSEILVSCSCLLYFVVV